MNCKHQSISFMQRVPGHLEVNDNDLSVLKNIALHDTVAIRFALCHRSTIPMHCRFQTAWYLIDAVLSLSLIVKSVTKKSTFSLTIT